MQPPGPGKQFSAASVVADPAERHPFQQLQRSDLRPGAVVAPAGSAGPVALGQVADRTSLCDVPQEDGQRVRLGRLPSWLLLSASRLAHLQNLSVGGGLRDPGEGTNAPQPVRAAGALTAAPAQGDPGDQGGDTGSAVGRSAQPRERGAGPAYVSARTARNECRQTTLIAEGSAANERSMSTRAGGGVAGAACSGAMPPQPCRRCRGPAPCRGRARRVRDASEHEGQGLHFTGRDTGLGPDRSTPRPRGRSRHGLASRTCGVAAYELSARQRDG